MSEPRISARQKRTVARRANNCCEYCWSQLKFSPDSFSVEHIIPRSAGGPHILDNLAFSCQGCNNRKYTSTSAIDPATGETVPLFNPCQHEWMQHFAWNKDYSLLVGLSPTGRATIDKLQLNREGVVNLRILLSGVGKHPPQRFSR